MAKKQHTFRPDKTSRLQRGIKWNYATFYDHMHIFKQFSPKKNGAAQDKWKIFHWASRIKCSAWQNIHFSYQTNLKKKLN